MKLSQPLLTQQISRWNGIQPEKKERLTLALSSQILEHDTEGEQKLTTWDYQSILGKLNYLEKSTRPDLT